MPSRLRLPILLVALFLVAPARGLAQTATYHLHKEVSDVDVLAGQLKTAGPEPPVTPYQSMDFKNLPVGDYNMKSFYTPPNVPNVAGVIPSGSLVSITFYMKKTSNWGVIVPRATT